MSLILKCDDCGTTATVSSAPSWVPLLPPSWNAWRVFGNGQQGPFHTCSQPCDARVYSRLQAAAVEHLKKTGQNVIVMSRREEVGR